jgi:hypothetical protein
MKKRYMQYLPLVAAMLALMAASAFAFAPIIDELPRVVIGGTNSFSNAVNLDAYIDWFPISTTEPWGSNRDYVGHPSKGAGYGSKSRFHVYVRDTLAGRTMTNAVTLADDVNLMGATNATPFTGALPAPAATDQYGVDPGSVLSPVKMSVAYSVAPAGTGVVDVFAVVEGEVLGNKLYAGYAPMTVVTGATANQTGYSIQLVSGRTNDTFFYWIPRLYPTVAGSFAPLPPKGRDTVTTTWANHALRSTTSVIGWQITGGAANYVPTAPAVALGVYNSGALTGTTAYACFIPANGGGVTAPVFQVKARLVASAAAAVNTPGYRVGFMNAAQTHWGILQVVNDTANKPFGFVGTGPGQRTIGHDFVARCYWATPTTMIDMADSGRIKPFGVTPTPVVTDADPTTPLLLDADGRDYALEIMCIGQSTSLGEFDVDSLSVITLATGDLTTTGTTKEWKGATATGGLTPLSAATWKIAFFVTPGITDGAGVIESNALLLWGAKDARLNKLANISTAGRFRLAKGSLTSAASILAASKALYRTTYTAQSGGISGDGNAQFSPVIQVHNSISNSGGQIDWYESWGPQAPLLKDPAVRPVGALTPGVPFSTPTTFSSYMWSHNVTGVGNVVLPEIYVYNTGVYNNTLWTDADGYFKFTDIKQERIGNVH